MTLENYKKLFNDEHGLNFSDDEPKYPFKMSDFKEIDIIASPRHLVKRMIHEPSNTKLAVKFVHIPHNRHKSDEENSKKLKYFIQVVADFRELRNVSNIVKLYGLGYYEGQALICMELMDLSLKEISLKFIENKEKLDEVFLGYIIVIVFKALAAYKSKDIIYQSVKPDNILLNQSGAIKLCGFGESRILQESLASTFNESLCYWPPEYFKNEKSELALANIWSLGISLIELVSGSVPYRDKNGKVPTNIILLQNMIINLNTNNTVEDHFNGYSEEIKNLVKSCLEPIEKRLNHEALKNNDFLKNYIATGSEKLVQDIIKKYHQNKTCHKTIDTIEQEGELFIYNEIENINLISRNEKSNSYKDVKSGSYRQKDIAIKTIPLKNTTHKMQLVERVRNEFENLRYASNASNIVKFYGYFIDTNDESRLYMELMDCNLRQFYHWIHAFGLFPENLLVYIIISLVDALYYCKSKKILHRDIKPTNILLNRSCEIKLCDFGSSIDLDRVEKTDLSPSGTIAYWAPELFGLDYIKQDYIKINESKEIFKTDVWSLGITLWETQSGRLPYLKEGETVSQSDIPRFENYILSIDGSKLDTDDFLPNYSKETKEFISSCLLKIEDRYDIEKLNELGVYFAKNKLRAVRKDFAEYMQKIEVKLDEIKNIDEGITTIDEGIDTISGSDETNIIDSNLSLNNRGQTLDAMNKKITQLEIEYLQKNAMLEEQCQLIAQKEILLKEEKQKFIDEKLKFAKQTGIWLEENANLEIDLQHINQFLPFNINITTKKGLLYFLSNDECVEFNSDIHLRIIYACRMSLCEIYPNFSEPKGIALIISNTTFPFPGGNRVGTEKDEQRLDKLFKKLEYKVILEKDLSATKMRDIVKSYAECPEQEKYSSFIVAILTHGDHDQLIGTDGKKTDSISIHKIIECVNTDILAGKPKIFIIQACRGGILSIKGEKLVCIIVLYTHLSAGVRYRPPVLGIGRLQMDSASST